MNKNFYLPSINKKKIFLIVVTFFLLIFIRLGLFIFPFQKLEKLIYGLTSVVKNRYISKKASISEIIYSLKVSCQLMGNRVMCLAKALTARLMLQIFDYDVDLKIGVTKTSNGTIKAHAWIEHREMVILGNLKELDNYKSFKLD